MPSFPNIPGGPVWDRPLRRGIKPEERADDIRPYGITVARHPAGARCAPLRKDRKPRRRAHNVRPCESRETEPVPRPCPHLVRSLIECTPSENMQAEKTPRRPKGAGGGVYIII